MRMLIIGCALFFAFIPIARSQSITGNELYEACTAPPDGYRSGYCSGYVTGIAEGTSLGATFYAIFAGAETADEAVAAADIALRICIPEGVIQQQIVAVFLSHLERNPEDRHLSAKWLFSSAMQEAFPCK